MDTPATFSPEFAEDTRSRLRKLLGKTWLRIEAEDEAVGGSTAPDRQRHPLAILYRRSEDFVQQFKENKFPGYFADFLALCAVVEILTRSANEGIFPEVTAGFADRSSFRHDMVTLGLADHIRTHTKYPVRLPTRGSRNERVVDLIMGESPAIEVETKSSEEFDGPQRHVTETDAGRAIRRAYRAALGGENPQLTGAAPTALLIGGISVHVASLPTIARVARRWLERKGGEHPNFWGILVLTFAAHARIPRGRTIGDGNPLTIDTSAGVQLAGAMNPHYNGPIEIRFTEAVWE